VAIIRENQLRIQKCVDELAVEYPNFEPDGYDEMRGSRPFTSSDRSIFDDVDG